MAFVYKPGQAQKTSGAALPMTDKTTPGKNSADSGTPQRRNIIVAGLVGIVVLGVVILCWTSGLLSPKAPGPSAARSVSSQTPEASDENLSGRTADGGPRRRKHDE